MKNGTLWIVLETKREMLEIQVQGFVGFEVLDGLEDMKEKSI